MADVTPETVPTEAVPTGLVGHRDLLRFTTAGSVDDGKSTLIGRLLYDSKQIFQDQMDQLEHSSRLRGEEQVNLALLTDGLRSEREQGITIDVAYRYFSTPERTFIIADTPGHEQYTRNMVTGASTADAAIILIDARNGVVTQSRRHGIIAGLLGIPHVVVCVNKMDLVSWSEERYLAIVEEYRAFAKQLNLHDVTFIPVSALKGDNVVELSSNMPWYAGGTLLQHLEEVPLASHRTMAPFRFPVQCVIRPHQDYRGFAGRVAAGSVHVGEAVTVLPSLRATRVTGIDAHALRLETAVEGQSVTLTLADEIDIDRGDMIVRSDEVPSITNHIDAVVTWMDDRTPLVPGTRYRIQHTTRSTQATVDRIVYRLDVNTLDRGPAESLELNQIARVELTTAVPLFVDAYEENRVTGGFIIIDPHDFRTVGAAMVCPQEHTGAIPTDTEVANTTDPVVTWDHGVVSRSRRQARNGHRPAVVWLTGLSGAGKSTIAAAAEERLFAEGYLVTRLDGDNMRHGLCSDLGFSLEDRSENLRRVGQVARLMYDMGAVVLCSFVSPLEADRQAIRRLFPHGDFLEVHVHVSLEEAVRRDTKGLYARAMAGELPDFTGVHQPFQAPSAAELTIDTEVVSPEEATRLVVEAATRRVLVSTSLDKRPGPGR